MQLIADKKVDLIQLDPGMGYTGGQYYNLMPIMAEKYTSGNPCQNTAYICRFVWVEICMYTVCTLYTVFYLIGVQYV